MFSMFYGLHNHFIMVSSWYANAYRLNFWHLKEVVIINETYGVILLGYFCQGSFHKIGYSHKVGALKPGVDSHVVIAHGSYADYTHVDFSQE
jgi:hypothetical protein